MAEPVIPGPTNVMLPPFENMGFKQHHCIFGAGVTVLLGMLLFSFAVLGNTSCIMRFGFRI